MKKLFGSLILVVASLILMVGFATAGGHFDVDAWAAGGAFDFDYEINYDGIAGGISGAYGEAEATSGGCLFQGQTGSDVTAYGGGITNTESYTIDNPVPGADVSGGVGSVGVSQSITGATADIYAGIGFARANILGFAAQGNLNGSAINNASGVTGGFACQGAMGGFDGSAGIFFSGEALLEAEIDMYGMSFSESYSFANSEDGVNTVGLGTFVGAETIVTSFGNAEDNGWAYGNVEGGWVAGGLVGATTIQDAPGGGAMASAFGSYSGSGALNSNYTGSATGYTQTSVTTFDGKLGSINYSGAGMHVSSNVTY